MNSQKNLFTRFIQDLPDGTLTWIGVRPERKQPVIAVESVMAVESYGLEGDHRMTKSPNSARQVTVISEEYIQQIGHFMGGISVDPKHLRRNLVVKNVNLSALRYQTFQIGEAIFEANALCHPCSRMEQALGKGAVAAMMGHGGLCCKVLKSGTISVGDAVQLIPTNTTNRR